MNGTARTLLAALVLAGIPSIANAEPPKLPVVRKIAMVDMQRVLNDTTAGKKARGALETSSKAKQEKLDKKRTKIEADVAKLKSLSGQQLASAQEAVQKESMELQSMLYALQQELAQQENKLLETMYKNSQEIVAKLADELGVDLVLVRDDMTVIYNDAGLDITDEVVKRYNQKHPK